MNTVERNAMKSAENKLHEIYSVILEMCIANITSNTWEELDKLSDQTESLLKAIETFNKNN